MSDDKATTFRDLAAKAHALEKKFVKLGKAGVPVPLDVDYDDCFVKAHLKLFAERKPSSFPRPLLRAKLLESLKNERESLRRVLADHDSRLGAALREMADWGERTSALTRDVAPSSELSDYRAVRELARTRLRQIAEYLDNCYPQPPREDQASPASGGEAGEAAVHPGSCDYLTVNQILEDLLEASTRSGDLQYIKLGQEHWLPHVQVLLDSGVAERDPQRSDHIKLTDWS
ncbi:hypothetical protein V5799_026832 [Amblyomma americanum]|uniref:Uncharacterized protein n=1 Tax=Amblyomma americanum TaxID=6943 RepID=A0AAQ4DHG6_AMBAM